MISVAAGAICIEHRSSRRCNVVSQIVTSAAREEEACATPLHGRPPIDNEGMSDQTDEDRADAADETPSDIMATDGDWTQSSEGSTAVSVLAVASSLPSASQSRSASSKDGHDTQSKDGTPKAKAEPLIVTRWSVPERYEDTAHSLRLQSVEQWDLHLYALFSSAKLKAEDVMIALNADATNVPLSSAMKGLELMNGQLAILRRSLEGAVPISQAGCLIEELLALWEDIIDKDGDFIFRQVRHLVGCGLTGRLLVQRGRRRTFLKALYSIRLKHTTALKELGGLKDSRNIGDVSQGTTYLRLAALLIDSVSTHRSQMTMTLKLLPRLPLATAATAVAMRIPTRVPPPSLYASGARSAVLCHQALHRNARFAWGSTT